MNAREKHQVSNLVPGFLLVPTERERDNPGNEVQGRELKGGGIRVSLKSFVKPEILTESAVSLT